MQSAKKQNRPTTEQTNQVLSGIGQPTEITNTRKNLVDRVQVQVQVLGPGPRRRAAAIRFRSETETARPEATAIGPYEFSEP